MADPRSEEIEPDDTNDDDSGYEYVRPSLTSLRSSVLAYHEENGRRYHALSRGKYAVPNDDAESDRLDLQHELMLLTLEGELCLCPKKETANRVLDLGTGTGIWAVDYADLHPEAEVIGVDLSPIQPTFVPPNCSFEIDDLENEWTWTKPFDFIFARMMIGSFTDLPGIIKTAYDHLQPGGYFEIEDFTIPIRCDDGSLPADSSLYEWSELILKGTANQGRPVFPTTEYKSYLEQAGFEGVVEVVRKWPSNSWPRESKYKEIGMWALEDIGGGLEGLSLGHLTRGLGWSREQTLLLCANVRKELRNPRLHAYWAIYVVYGKKPDNTPVQKDFV